MSNLVTSQHDYIDTVGVDVADELVDLLDDLQDQINQLRKQCDTGKPPGLL